MSLTCKVIKWSVRISQSALSQRWTYGSSPFILREDLLCTKTYIGCNDEDDINILKVQLGHIKD